MNLIIELIVFFTCWNAGLNTHWMCKASAYLGTTRSLDFVRCSLKHTKPLKSPWLFYQSLLILQIASEYNWRIGRRIPRSREKLYQLRATMPVLNLWLGFWLGWEIQYFVQFLNVNKRQLKLLKYLFKI